MLDLPLIKRSIPLSSLLAEYGVTLKRQSSSRSIARCCFHEEKTASLTVFDDIRFNCFGCGAHGDIFEALRLLEGISLGAAIHRLAERVGMKGGLSIPRRQSVYAKEENAMCQWWWKRTQEKVHDIGAEELASPDLDQEFIGAAHRVMLWMRKLNAVERVDVFRRMVVEEDWKLKSAELKSREEWLREWMEGYEFAE